MSLAPIIERYMSLRRQESDICREFLSMTRSIPLPVEDYKEIFEVFAALVALQALLCEDENPASGRTYIERHGAELAALNEAMVEIAKKIRESRVKCTYTVRPQIGLKFSESTSRVLTSSSGRHSTHEG